MTERTRPRVTTRGLVLTERDLDVLRAVGRAGVLTTDQLARDHFPSLDRTRTRLRRLFDAGFVTRHVVDSRSPDLYTLTRSGCTAAGGGSEQFAVLRRAPSYAGLEHARLVGDALLYVQALTSITPGAALVRAERGHGGLARLSGLAGRGVVPDLIAIVRSDAGEATIAIEADAGTEPIRVLAAKWAAYERCLARGAAVSEVWCVAAGGARRLSALWRGMADRPVLAERARLLTAAAVEARPVRPPARRGAGPDEAPRALESGITTEAHTRAGNGRAPGRVTSDTTLDTIPDTRGSG